MRYTWQQLITYFLKSENIVKVLLINDFILNFAEYIRMIETFNHKKNHLFKCLVSTFAAKYDYTGSL